MHRLLLLAAVLLAGCGGASAPALLEPPKQVRGGWTLSSATPPTETFPLALQPAQSWRTTYSGPQDVTATFYRFNSNTEAFEALQKWKKAPGEITFHDGAFLVVIPPQEVPRQATGDFAEGVMAAIP
jgi:hypothetical protein